MHGKVSYRAAVCRLLAMLLLAVGLLPPGVAEAPRPAAGTQSPAAIHIARGTFVFEAGGHDPQGHFLGATEVRDLVAYQGRLYAGLGQWMDDPTRVGASGPPDPAMPAQVIVLESPDGEWRREVWFPERGEDGSYLYFAPGELARLEIADGVELLAVGLWRRSGFTTVLIKHPKTGRWVDTGFGEVFRRFLADRELKDGALAEVRALYTYTDSVTGTTAVFLGAGVPTRFGTPGAVDSDVVLDTLPVGPTIWKGVYDAERPGLIRWDKQPEANLNGTEFPIASRVMAFAATDQGLLSGTSAQIAGVASGRQSAYVIRRRDGPKPRWEVLVAPKRLNSIAVRAMRQIPEGEGEGGVLLALEGSGKLLRFVSEQDALHLEQDMAAWYRTVKRYDARYVLPYQLETYRLSQDAAGPIRLFVGASALTKSPKRPFRTDPRGIDLFTYEGGYWWRTGSGQWRMGEVVDPDRSPMPRLVATRAFAPSPFPEERGKVVYLGFYDCYFFPAHNTARIMRVPVSELFPEASSTGVRAHASESTAALGPSGAQGNGQVGVTVADPGSERQSATVADSAGSAGH